MQFIRVQPRRRIPAKTILLHVTQPKPIRARTILFPLVALRALYLAFWQLKKAAPVNSISTIVAQKLCPTQERKFTERFTAGWLISEIRDHSSSFN